MINWGIVLHFYQPPTQNGQVTEAVFEQCYKPLVELIATQPRARVTINISGSLVNHPLFEKLKPCVESGQVDMLLSPTTHPLLPLIGDQATNELLSARKQDEMVGIFPPELAVDENVIERVFKFGDYCLIDESSVGGELGYVYNGHKLLVSSRMITEIMRSYPRELKVEPFCKYLIDTYGTGKTIVSVNDAELFGHHYQERLDFFRQILLDERLSFKTAKEIVEDNKDKFSVIPKITPSTWQTSYEQRDSNNPWSLWVDPTNRLQQQYLSLSRMAENLLEPFWEYQNDPGLILDSARRHFFIGISSCHLYWLSNKPWWHPDLVEEGANQLIKCIRSLPVDTHLKAEAEELHKQLTTDMWQYHWSGEVEKGYVRHQEERQKMLALLPLLG